MLFNYPHFDRQNSIVLIKIQMNVKISEYSYGTRDMDHNLILQEFSNKLLNIYTGWYNCNNSHYTFSGGLVAKHCMDKLLPLRKLNVQ